MFSGRLSGLAWLVPFLVLAPLGCSDSTRPPEDTGGDGAATVNGSIDPGEGTFLLTTISAQAPDGIPIRVELIGSSLEVNMAPDHPRVSLNVAIRNADTRTLYAPAEVRVGEIEPGSVSLVEADWIQCPNDWGLMDYPSGSCWYGLLYSDLLGDGVLEPGETSAPRRWKFGTFALESFSFSATARFGLDPDRPRISGLYFWDNDWTGTFTSMDVPYVGGNIQIRTPGDAVIQVVAGPDGRYAFPVSETGLYTLTAIEPPLGSPLPIHYTTPNPLQVLLTPGPDGRPRNFDHADFGFALGFPPGYPPVILFPGPPDSLVQDRYDLTDASLQGTVLHLRVGYSGCQPDHPLQLYMVGGFMESNPVQVKVILSHNSLGELCEAYWAAQTGFDLRAIQEAYLEAYGRLDPIVIRFEDWTGTVHTLDLLP